MTSPNSPHTVDDGGPAFPPGYEPDPNDMTKVIYTGISKRDWFATHASEEDISAHREMTIADDGYPCWSRSREEARYRYADAMLRARTTGEN